MENPKYHRIGETTFDHTKQVVNNSLFEPINDRNKLSQAALFHDFAKPLKNKLFVDHSISSAIIAKNLGLSDDVVNAIKNHMKFMDKVPDFDGSIATSLKRSDMNFGSKLIPIYRSNMVDGTSIPTESGFIMQRYTALPERAAAYFNTMYSPNNRIDLYKSYIPLNKFKENSPSKLTLPIYNQDEVIVPIGWSPNSVIDNVKPIDGESLYETGHRIENMLKSMK